MTDATHSSNWLCRLFGHKWERAFVLRRLPAGLGEWVYTDDVCQRCYKREYRLPLARDVP